MTYTSESRTPQAAISSRRMARRLLSGAGCASLTAYRLDDGAPSQLGLHALDVTGSIIVAAHPAADHPMVDVPCEAPVEVRLDVALEAAEPGLRITTATVHLLGVLTWLDDGGRDAVLSGSVAGCHCAITGEDPLTDLAELARAPGGRLGVVETSRIMVHDAMGVSGHTMEEVLDPDAKGVRPLLWSARRMRSRPWARARSRFCAMVWSRAVSPGSSAPGARPADCTRPCGDECCAWTCPRTRSPFCGWGARPPTLFRSSCPRLRPVLTRPGATCGTSSRRPWSAESFRERPGRRSDSIAGRLVAEPLRSLRLISAAPPRTTTSHGAAGAWRPCRVTRCGVEAGAPGTRAPADSQRAS